MKAKLAEEGIVYTDPLWGGHEDSCDVIFLPPAPARMQKKLLLINANNATGLILPCCNRMNAGKIPRMDWHRKDEHERWLARVMV